MASSPSLPVDLAALQKHLHQTTSFAAALPPKADLAFHRSVDPALATRLDEASGRVWALVDSLLGLVDGLDDGAKKAGAASKKRRREEEDLVENFEQVVVAEGVDGLLERADTCLDTFLGRLKAPAIPIVPTETARSKNNIILPGSAASAKSTRLPASLINAQIPKPQLLFPPPKVDNFPTAEFKVYSSGTTPDFVKHHAQVPVDYVAAAPDDVAVVEPAEAINPSAGGSSAERRPPTKLVPPHPYTYELLHPAYPTSLLAPKACTPVSPASFADTPFTFVSTAAELKALITTLEREATHLAVDLEHHSTRTFAGFLCLAQMTARNAAGKVLGDWVIDLVVPEVREAMRTHMGRVLANPDIIKIFHGAESDIVWLQQNFDLFVVNMFDTYHATKVLEFPSHSLASLLELYCDFMADKRYQLADWRIRPLPQEMLDYARSDTHFLLFIFDHLQNALISRSSPRSSPSLNMPPTTPAGGSFAVNTPLLLQHVLARSAQTCLRRFAADIYDADAGLGPAGWFTLARKYNKLFLLDAAPGTPPAVEGAVFKRLHAWRDAVGREEDESTAYVLKNHQLFVLASRKPATVKELFLLGQQFSEVVRRRADELVDLIRTTAEGAEGTAGPSATQPMDGVVASSSTGTSAASAPRQVVDVWGAVQEPAAATKAPAVASSSLFGPSFSSRAAAATPNAVASSSRSYTASSSSLFGSVGARASRIQAAKGNDMFASSPSSSSKGAAQDDAFLQVLSKINLSINPPLPPPAPAPSPAPVAAPAAAPQAAAAEEVFTVPGVEEVPFVPASSRAAKPQPPAEDKDAIVTVGRPKEKKRKRDKTADAGAADAGAVDKKGKGREAPSAEVDEEESASAPAAGGKTFDYSAVPNGLDQVVKKDAPNKLKKAKKVKKAIVEYGDFKRPPQSMAETKKGHKNMTFK